jgi:hypothetical protein
MLYTSGNKNKNRFFLGNNSSFSYKISPNYIRLKQNQLPFIALIYILRRIYITSLKTNTNRHLSL